MDSLKWVKFQHKEILSVTFLKCSEEESLIQLKSVVHELSSREKGEVLMLADLTQASFWPRVALEWQRQQQFLNSKCSKVAVLGAMGVISIAVQTFLNVAQAGGLRVGEKARFFENPDLAKEWLVSEDGQWPRMVG